MIELKPKPYYRIGEVAKHLGVQTHVLRYWESEFPQLGPTRAPSGHRLYKAADLEKLGQVKDLLHVQGYTLAGAKRYLQEQQEQQDEPAPRSEPQAKEEAPAENAAQPSLSLNPAPQAQASAPEPQAPAGFELERQEILSELRDILTLLS